MSQRLANKRVLVTNANDFMGAPTIEVFEEEGAEVIADYSNLVDNGAASALIEATGHVDVLVINLAAPSYGGIPTHELNDENFAECFDVMVYPLHRLTRAVLPQMVERKAGKIVVYGSASALKGMKTLAAYSAARGAQVSYVQSVGIEIAPQNIQMNLIAQNYVENPDYYPHELTSQESFKSSLKRQVPLGRLATSREDAQLAAFLASNESDFFVGQAIPFAGGWVQR